VARYQDFDRARWAARRRATGIVDGVVVGSVDAALRATPAR
jgi:hypothetical protein